MKSKKSVIASADVQSSTIRWDDLSKIRDLFAVPLKLLRGPQEDRGPDLFVFKSLVRSNDRNPSRYFDPFCSLFVFWSRFENVAKPFLKQKNVNHEVLLGICIQTPRAVCGSGAIVVMVPLSKKEFCFTFFECKSEFLNTNQIFIILAVSRRSV